MLRRALKNTTLTFAQHWTWKRGEITLHRDELLASVWSFGQGTMISIGWIEIPVSMATVGSCFVIWHRIKRYKPTYNFDSVASYNMSCQPPATTTLTLRVRFCHLQHLTKQQQISTPEPSKPLNLSQHLSPTATHFSPICLPRGMRHC